MPGSKITKQESRGGRPPPVLTPQPGPRARSPAQAASLHVHCPEAERLALGLALPSATTAVTWANPDGLWGGEEHAPGEVGKKKVEQGENAGV